MIFTTRKGATYVEETKIPSPMIVRFIQGFKVPKTQRRRTPRDEDIYTAIINYRSRYFETQTWDGHLRPPTDSLDPFDDEDLDELIKMTTERGTSGEAQDIQENDEDSRLEDQHTPEDHTEIMVHVRPTSISLDNPDHQIQFNCNIRSTAVLPYDEHSDRLLVTLSTGQLFILKVISNENFENDYHFSVIDQLWQTPHTMIKAGAPDGFKFPVSFRPRTNDIGRDVLAHSNGLIFASTSYEGLIRFHRISTKLGIDSPVEKYFNYDVNGTIVDYCFIEPIDDKLLTHAMFAVLYQPNNSSILSLRLLELYADAPFEKVETAFSPVLLNNQTEIPYFMVPLKNTQGFLYVTKNVVTFMGVSFLISHGGKDNVWTGLYEYGADDEVPHPVSYHVPRTPIPAEGLEYPIDSLVRMDQILIADSQGQVFAVEVFLNTGRSDWSIRSTKLFKFYKPFAAFSLEIADDMYTFDYACSAGTSASLLCEIRKGSLKPALKLQSYPNWANVSDVITVPPLKLKTAALPTNEELWCLTSCGSKSGLWNLKRGFKAAKHTVDDTNQPMTRMFKVSATDYCFCSVESSQIMRFDLGSFFPVWPKGDPLYKPTIFCGPFSSTSDRVVWVTENGIRLFDSDTYENLEEFETPYTITMCHAAEGFLLIHYETSERRPGTELFKLEGNSLRPYTLNLSHGQLGDVSFMKILQFGGEPFIVIGNYEDNVLVFQVNETEKAMISIQRLDIPTLISNGSTVSQRGFKIPSDAYVHEYGTCKGVFPRHEMIRREHDRQISQPVTGLDESHFRDRESIDHIDVEDIPLLGVEGPSSGELVIGSRNGFACLVRFTPIEGKFVIVDVQSFQLGDKAVEFVDTGSQVVYAISRNIWKFELSSTLLPLPVVIQERFSKSTYNGVFFNADHYSLHGSLLTVRSRGVIELLSVDNYQSTFSKQIRLKTGGSKVMYMPLWGIFVILTPQERNRGDSIEKLLFVDHVTQAVMNGSFTGDERSPNGLFELDENPRCMSQWDQLVTDDDGVITGTHVHLVIGCEVIGANTGMVKVVDIRRIKNSRQFDVSEDEDSKKSHDFVMVTHLTSWKCSEGPVTAIAQIPNSGEIIYSCGKQLFIFHYNSQTKRMVRSFDKQKFTSNVIGITVNEREEILISLEDDSVVLFHWTPRAGTFEKVAGDTTSRQVMSKALSFEADQMVVVADKVHSTITALTRDGDLLQPDFTTSLPFIPRLEKCTFKPLWYKEHQSEPEPQFDKDDMELESSKSYVDRRFLACGVDGEVRVYSSTPIHPPKYWVFDREEDRTSLQDQLRYQTQENYYSVRYDHYTKYASVI
ncbi:unnamed protein product [Kuraishia capsulata CBS 1993]|uniref:Uncharacterized protein n=1 Tax=Kuraishia capsulata CBS 1993 TaxID=1382522 RepID=W6MI49_9ASCO|nr:uncharacterized protein KUCA_T00001766001 [Kuraishia capsulata CBS 1993]CDK25796.1 unnamed protein product [Kuraishia capsulata CBS 1993]